MLTSAKTENFSNRQLRIRRQFIWVEWHHRLSSEQISTRVLLRHAKCLDVKHKTHVDSIPRPIRLTQDQPGSREAYFFIIKKHNLRKFAHYMSKLVSYITLFIIRSWAIPNVSDLGQWRLWFSIFSKSTLIITTPLPCTHEFVIRFSFNFNTS